MSEIDLGGGLFFRVVKIQEGAVGTVEFTPVINFCLHEDDPTGGHIIDRCAA